MSGSNNQQVDVDLTSCLAFFECISPHKDSENGMHLYPGEEIMIGRDDTCTYVIPNLLVSKRHFRIYSIVYEMTDDPRFPPLIYCEDLESSNGTYVNNILIGMISREKKGYLLCAGDVIEIRPFWKFRFHQENRQVLNIDQSIGADLKYFRKHYDVSERKLGGGRYGDVFLATEVESTKQIACKIVNLRLAIQELSKSQPSAACANWAASMRFAKEQKGKVMREIKLLAKLSHPNVIDIKKAFCSEHALYIFTELAAGGDLFSYMQTYGGSLDDHNSRVITLQVTLALQYIHSEGMAHRDLKPENVLVTGTHFGGRVILTDFGFAIDAKSNRRTGRMMSMVGTDGYVAPEVESVENSDTGYTRAVDMWSLGVLTACMFTGDTIIPRHELPELSCEEIAARYEGLDDSPAAFGWLHIPPRARRFIRRLIIVNPEERMAADEALNDSWFTKPAGEAVALKAAIGRICRFWTKRESNDNLLEGFPGVIIDSLADTDPPVTKLKRKFPDTSASPYFGLDRHLLSRPESTRKQMIDDLNQSGSQFLKSSEPTHTTTSLKMHNGRKRKPSVVTVEGSDLFASSKAMERSLRNASKLDEVDVVQTHPVFRKLASSSRLQDQIDVSTSFTTNASDLADLTAHKRARKESEDRRTHDAAVKELPRYTNAKELREKVNRMMASNSHANRVKATKAV